MTLMNAAETLDKTAVDQAVAAMNAIENELNGRFVERSQAVRGALVALVARQHVFLLGAPGGGKSALLTALSERILDNQGQSLKDRGEFFKKLLSRLSKLEEVIGPVSLAALDNDQYRHKTDRYLPSARIAFIDEIWKGNSSVNNAMLGIVNEREFDDDGQMLETPLITMFAASNEMPQGEDLGALWDRIIIRYFIESLSESGHRLFLDDVMGRRKARAAGQNVSGSQGTTITLEQLELLQQAALAVDVPKSVLADYYAIYNELAAKGKPLPSPRREEWLWDVVCAYALLNGHQQVQSDDLTILAHCLWERPEDRREIASVVYKIANPAVGKAQELVDNAASVFTQFVTFLKNNPKAAQAQKNAQLMQLRADFNKLAPEFKTLAAQAQKSGSSTRQIDALQNQMKTMWDQAHEMSGVGTGLNL